MSRSISWLRSTRSSPGRGSQCLLGGHSTVPTWGASTTTRARIGRIANVQKTQTSRPFSRSFSTHKSANDNGRTSRFKKSEASLTEPLRRADGENTPTEPTPTHPASSEPVGSSTTTYQPAPSPSPRSQGPADANPQIPPKARKPVDTSSKEYKQAASRYIRFVVAFPVLVVTSYFLCRFVLDTGPDLGELAVRRTRWDEELAPLQATGVVVTMSRGTHLWKKPAS